jgi:hypothetical protein
VGRPAGQAAAGRAVRAALATLLLLLVAGLVPGRATSPEPAPAACGTPLLLVRHAHPVDLAHACEGWRRLAGFLLERHGLRVAAPIELRFAERVEVEFGPQRLRVLGYHDRAARLVHVTSMAAAWLREPDRLMFGQPVDEELHTSLVVHELTHAVLKDNYRIAAPGLACDEYLAAVVQFATMQPAMRGRILAAYPPGDFATTAEINDACFLLAPHDFGVRSWRHFAREGHGGMIEAILSGRIRGDGSAP